MPSWVIIVIAVALMLFQAWFNNLANSKKLKRAVEETRKQGMKKVTSLAVNHGFIAEQWFPVSLFNTFKNYEMHYFGKPIDYIAFGPDEIVFIELKTGESYMSSKQRNIKQQIEQGRVKFVEIRMEDSSGNNRVEQGVADSSTKQS